MHTTAGGFADAVTCLTRALKGMDGRIEPDQPAFTDCLEALISTYINMGRAADAEPHLRRKIQISEAKSGLEHPDLVSDQIRLMILLQNSGRLNLAEEYIERSVNALKARVGMDHVQTARLLDARRNWKSSGAVTPKPNRSWIMPRASWRSARARCCRDLQGRLHSGRALPANRPT